MTARFLPQRARTRLMWGGFVGLAALLAFAGYLASKPNPAASQQPTPQYPAWESPKLFTFPGDWNSIRATTVRTIYPAQASWEWVTSPEHLGSASVQAGTPCATCHGNPLVGQSSVPGWAGPPADHKQSLGCQACHGVLRQDIGEMGEELVEGEYGLENDPIEGKRPYVDVQVKAAYDADYLYLRFEWAAARPGILLDLWRWNGQKWEAWGGPKPDAPKAGRTPSYEDRLTLLVGLNIPAQDGARVGFSQAGCWVTCHSSLVKMPLEPTVEQIKADPYLGDKGLKKTEVLKYLLITRKETDAAGGWNKAKSREEIQRLLQLGQFLDMLMWRAARSGPLGYADDFYVLDYRNADKGKSMFSENALKDGKPTYMYDASKVGFNAIPEARLEELLTKSPLILGVTAVPFNPTATFQIGDIISRRVLTTPDGSRADILANSRWENGKWVLEMRRKLNTGNPDDVTLEPGKVFTIGIAIHDDMVSNRRHHVSFPVTLGLGVPADIVAVPVAQRTSGG
ncbi:Cytochrome c-552 [bacterium HR23]|nr:Cytochrome c-552 [bacterium HR23]